MNEKKLSVKEITNNLILYGITHAVIDGICAAVIFSILRGTNFTDPEFVSLVILYNVLAFALQSGIGLLSDYFKTPYLFAILGCVLTGISALTFINVPILAIILAGLGNAFFHIGGGSISLNLIPRKTIAPGIFVATGAIGILIGTLIGKSGHFISWPIIIVLLIICFLMFKIRKPLSIYNIKEKDFKSRSYFTIILILIFLTILVRSLVGMVVIFPWKTDVNLLIFLTIAITLGKGLGGLLADRFGWMKIGVGALILSIPLIVFGSNIPYLAIIGMFLFNITMPITLVVLSNILPNQPGFAFGLTCLALVFGALPAFSNLKPFLGQNIIVLFIIVISTITLYFGLKAYSKNNIAQQ